MNAERYGQVKKVFFEACALPPQERAAYVAQACGHDVALRREVESLLEHDDRSSENAWSRDVAVGIVGADPASSAEDRIDRRLLASACSAALPERIGRYRILSVLGEGG
ncbi:MAG: hypothetical protein D6744_04905, partial [Planctomycetota bacterium]